MDGITSELQPHGVINVGVLDSSVLQREVMAAALRTDVALRVSLASDLRSRPGPHASAPLDVLLLCVPQCDYSVNTVELVEQWHAGVPNAGIVLLVQRYRKPTLTRLLRAGLRGHLVQWATTLPVLVQTIQDVHAGHVVLCDTTKRALFSDTPAVAHLTEREQEVVALLADPRRRTRKQVAAVLGVSESTINNHLAHISDKLGAYGLQDILARCRDAGVVEDAPYAEVEPRLFGPTL
jgi:DNA-binding NarL/FixJ family response regulator